jgi:glycosyltransferase involved in cell wall biosynthesis
MIISVVIPTYNRADFIAEAIESVLNQKAHKHSLEVIIVDDGSTDGTSGVVKKFGNKVKYIKIPHSGKPAVPRNVGIKAASGELIAFQDSDDLWHKDKLAKQISLFTDKNVVLSYANAEIMKADGTLTGSLVVDEKSLRDGRTFAALAKGNVVSTLTVVARKSAIEKVNFFDEADDLRAVEDYCLWLRIASKFPNGIKVLPETLAYYRTHDSNISRTNPLEAIEQLLSVFNHLWLAGLSISQLKIVESRLFELHEGWGRIMNERYSFDQPTISVVLTVYNGGEHLKTAIQSILKQTYHNFEFIIIDDGSSDDSFSTISKFKDRRIRLVRQTNHGLVYSLNKGVKLARGRFIARQDADDISMPTRFEKLISAITANDRMGLVGTFFTYIDEKTSQPSITITSVTKHLDLRRSFYITNPFAHGSTLIRKDAIVNAGGYTDEYGPTEDFELWRRLAEKWELGIVPEPLYWYRINPNGISHKKQSSQHKFAAKIIAEQWRRPFLYKGYRAIVKDAQYYRRLPSPFAEQVYNQYINEQFVIAMGLFGRGKYSAGLVTFVATCRLDRSKVRQLVRLVISKLARRLGIRKKKR